MNTILIIDDDLDICETMASLVTRLGHRCTAVRSLKEARRVINEEPHDVVFLDVGLPDGNGLELLPDINERSNRPEVIILTGKGDPDGAELAIEGGVWEYLLKPSSVKEITLTLNRALRYRLERAELGEEQDPVLFGIIGESPEIKAACRQMMQAAQSESNLLISGETGTGKEIFAQAIHRNSSRSSGNFVAVDCASLTESLVESTLFGHRKGAFTGAHDNRQGLVKMADKGTLFLDEIGDMPLSIQRSFLRVLQERRFRPVGDTSEQTSDFRLIAATNRDLGEMVEAGTFRSDLLFRIKTMMLHLPPLRERSGDVRVLAAHKSAELCRQMGREDKSISSGFFETLERYSWPGNVRELFNMVERAIIDAGNETQLFAMHLPRSLRIQVAKEQIKTMTGSAAFADQPPDAPDFSVQKIGHDIFSDIFDRDLPSLKLFKSMAEKVYLSELIRQGDGDIGKILEISGLSRSHFYALLKKHRLTVQTD